MRDGIGSGSGFGLLFVDAGLGSPRTRIDVHFGHDLNAAAW